METGGRTISEERAAAIGDPGGCSRLERMRMALEEGKRLIWQNIRMRRGREY